MNRSDQRALSTRIDFIGVAGVGKSTLCSAVLAALDRAGSEGQWLGMGAAIRLASRSLVDSRLESPPGELREQLSIPRRVYDRFLRSLSIPISRNRDAILSQLRLDHGERCALENAEFVASFLEHAGDRYSNDADWLERVRKRHRKRLENWGLVRASGEVAGVLADDYQLNFSFAPARWCGPGSASACGSRKPLAALCRSGLAPAGLVHVHCVDCSLTFDRLLKREPGALENRKGLQGFTWPEVIERRERTAQDLVKAVDFMGEAGIPVLTVLAEDSVERNVVKVEAFLEEVANRLPVEIRSRGSLASN